PTRSRRPVLLLRRRPFLLIRRRPLHGVEIRGVLLNRGAHNPPVFRMVIALSDLLLKKAPVPPRRDDDPLQLNLPPLLAGPDIITPDALRGLAAMYLQAELEQTGLIVVVELLADA